MGFDFEYESCAALKFGVVKDGREQGGGLSTHFFNLDFFRQKINQKEGEEDVFCFQIRRKLQKLCRRKLGGGE